MLPRLLVWFCRRLTGRYGRDSTIVDGLPACASSGAKFATACYFGGGPSARS